ncbi:zeta toxin family protein [Leucobacter sp. M11]|uniref:zeta toxin family protein n=1 Tax=Leucobacter sp. M11 TaxID=2993565 RepID=UPI003FA5AA85
MFAGHTPDQAAPAIRFADLGYRVEVVSVATTAPVSRLSAAIRSLDIGYPAVGRWTPPAAHETALEHSSEVVAALERLPQVARVPVFSRESLLHTNSRTENGEWTRPGTATQTFRAEQHRRLDDREADALPLRSPVRHGAPHEAPSETGRRPPGIGR